MPFPRRTIRILLLLPAILFRLAEPDCRSQEITVHLRGGDVIHGTVVLETPENLTLSNSWNPRLVLPVQEIQNRETVLRTNSPAAGLASKHLAATNSTAPLKGATNSPSWLTEITLGADLERGAKDHQTVYGRTRLTYTHPYQWDQKQVFKSILTYDAAYGRAGDQLSDNRMNFSTKLDADISRRHYFYNLGEAGYDKVRLIDLRYEEGPGAGYHWLTRSNLVANVELGADYEDQERSDSTSKKSFYYRAAQDLNWKINRQMTLTEKFEYFPQAGNSLDYRIRFESTLSYAILRNLSLNFTVADLYDSQPAESVPDNDFQFRTTLSVKF